MVNPYTPARRSHIGPYPRWDYLQGVAIAQEFGDNGVNEPKFLLEDSRNWFSWIEAQDSDSYVDLAEMR